MAKGKSNPSAKTPAKSSAKAKTAPANADGRSSTAKLKAQPQPSISNEKIGHLAGDIWRLLDKDGGQNLAALKKATGASNELVLAAIGWLAREDKLDFTTSGRTLKISLR